MPRFALNKSSLQKERERLKLLERLLPSLDLKRRQLLLELQKATTEVAKREHELAARQAEIGRQLPMLATEAIDVAGLVRLQKVVIEQENVVGVRLPVLRDLRFTVAEYSFLAKPAWVDVLILRLQETITLRLHLQVAQQRVAILAKAVRRVTQRLNLFEKILIPQTKQNIKKIQIYLGDAERAAVVRAKLAKQKRQRLGKEVEAVGP